MADIGGTRVRISPAIMLDLEAKNSALPINLIQDASDIGEIDFAGSFGAKLNVAVDGIPAEIFITAASDDISNAASVDFSVGVDIDLYPVRDTVSLLRALEQRCQNQFHLLASHLLCILFPSF